MRKQQKPKTRWIAETLFEDEGFRMAYRADRVLYEEKTTHQDLVLFQNKFFGKMLMLDGATQVTARDEFVYHEMMTHVPVLAHGRARRVLIIGGGDGGILREVVVFPMNQRAEDLLMGAPSEVTQKQLRELHIRLNLPQK